MASETAEADPVKMSSSVNNEQRINQLIKSASKKKKKKKAELNNSRNRLFHKSNRFNNSNLTIIRQTLRANNRDLAKALQNVKEELNLSTQINLELQEERQEILMRNSQLSKLASINLDNIEKQVISHIKIRMSEVRGVLNKVSTNLLSTVNHLSEALQMCTDPEPTTLESFCRKSSVYSAGRNSSSASSLPLHVSPEPLHQDESSLISRNQAFLDSIKPSLGSVGATRTRRVPLCDDLTQDMDMIMETSHLVASEDTILYTADNCQKALQTVTEAAEKIDNQLSNITSRHRRSKSKRSSSLRFSGESTNHQSDVSVQDGTTDYPEENAAILKRKSKSSSTFRNKKPHLTDDAVDAPRSLDETVTVSPACSSGDHVTDLTESVESLADDDVVASVTDNDDLIESSDSKPEQQQNDVSSPEKVTKQRRKSVRLQKSSNKDVTDKDSKIITYRSTESETRGADAIKSSEGQDKFKGQSKKIDVDISENDNQTVTSTADSVKKGLDRLKKKSKLPQPLSSQKDLAPTMKSPDLDQNLDQEDPYGGVTQIYSFSLDFNKSKSSITEEPLSEAQDESPEEVATIETTSSDQDEMKSCNDAKVEDNPKEDSHSDPLCMAPPPMKTRPRRETFVKPADLDVPIMSMSKKNTAKSSRRGTFVKPTSDATKLGEMVAVTSNKGDENMKMRRGTFFVKPAKLPAPIDESTKALTVLDLADAENVDMLSLDIATELPKDLAYLEESEPSTAKSDYLHVDDEPTMYLNTDMELTAVMPPKFVFPPFATGVKDKENGDTEKVAPSVDDCHREDEASLDTAICITVDEAPDLDKCHMMEDHDTDDLSKDVQDKDVLEPPKRPKRKSYVKKSREINTDCEKPTEGKCNKNKKEKDNNSRGKGTSVELNADKGHGTEKSTEHKPTKMADKDKKLTKDVDKNEKSEKDQTNSESQSQKPDGSKSSDASVGKPPSKFVAYSNKPGSIIFQSGQRKLENAKTSKGHSRSKSRPATLKMKPRSRPRSKTANIQIPASKEKSIFDFVSPGKEFTNSEQVKTAFDMSMNETIQGPLPSLAELRDKAGIPTNITVEGLLTESDKPKSILLVDKGGKRTKPRARKKTVNLASPAMDSKTVAIASPSTRSKTASMISPSIIVTETPSKEQSKSKVVNSEDLCVAETPVSKKTKSVLKPSPNIKTDDTSENKLKRSEQSSEKNTNEETPVLKKTKSLLKSSGNLKNGDSSEIRSQRSEHSSEKNTNDDVFISDSEGTTAKVAVHSKRKDLSDSLIPENKESKSAPSDDNISETSHVSKGALNALSLKLKRLKKKSAAQRKEECEPLEQGESQKENIEGVNKNRRESNVKQKGDGDKNAPINEKMNIDNKKTRKRSGSFDVEAVFSKSIKTCEPVRDSIDDAVSGRRPSRRAASNIKSFKELSLGGKLRRGDEGTSSIYKAGQEIILKSGKNRKSSLLKIKKDTGT